MASRPEFNKDMDVNYFQKFYWYKTELEDICRENKLPSFGTKSELNNYIIEFLRGTPPKDIRPIRRIRRQSSNKLTADKINLDTKLLNSGFSLNNEARKFFSNYFGVEKFSFKKSMGIKMRDVEKNNDNTATVSDLIDVFQNQIINLDDNNEELTYQWNNFFKDFCHDPIFKKFNEPMKVASILWKKVRNSENDKRYSRKILEDNHLIVDEYLKK